MDNNILHGKLRDMVITTTENKFLGSLKCLRGVDIHSQPVPVS